MVLNTDELDFAGNPYNAQDIKDNPGKLELFENRRRREETSLKPQQKDSSMLLLAQKTGHALYTKPQMPIFLNDGLIIAVG